MVRRRPGGRHLEQGDERATSRTKAARPSRSSWKSARHKGVLLVALAGVAFVLLLRGARRPSPFQPFQGPRLTSLPQFSGDHGDRLLWGTYRPGLYFGMRKRLPKSPLFGLMWTNLHDKDPLANIRHETKQSDGLDRYGWLLHDGESFGLQELLDGPFNISISMAKRWCDQGCPPGGDWAALLDVQRRPALEPGSQQRRRLAAEAGGSESEDKQGAEQTPVYMSVFLYLALEEGELSLSPAGVEALQQPGLHGMQEEPLAVGRSSHGGRWSLHIRQGSTMPRPAVQVHRMALRQHAFHNLTDTVRGALWQSLRAQAAAGAQQYHLALPDVLQDRPNMLVLQLTSAVPFSLEVAFLDGEEGSTDGTPARHARLAALQGPALRALLDERRASFEERFAATFGSLDAMGPPGTAAAARAALSNMLGGIGYWHGHSLVHDPAAQHRNAGEQARPLWDATLFSAVPSRSFFPRGFLWDEGFHQLVVRSWSPDLSRDILAHWLDLMNARGWIAREQILGPEAEARVPAEFVVQSFDAANPPTFFLLLREMAESLAEASPAGSELDEELLRAAWPRLQAWYRWFNTTQVGPVAGSYRWRGRDAATDRELNPKTLTSGLDDFPRASHPSDDERHVDLLCWMALASRAMATIGAKLRMPRAQVEAFESTAAALEDPAHLNRLHLDPETGRYSDWGQHTEAVRLARAPPLPDGSLDDRLVRVVDEPPQPRFVPHYGYVSLMPLVAHLLPPSSAELGAQLELLRGEVGGLWTPYGLRSLSVHSTIYGQRNTRDDAPYWRGAIWVNFNYLVLEGLRHYSTVHGPHRATAAALHEQLRAGLLGNLVEQYASSGYLWEQYDDTNGHGKGSHPFTGWTALLVLLAADRPR